MTVADLTIDGGTCYYESSGTCTNLYCAGTIDFRNDPNSRTFANITLYSGYEWHDPYGTVTASNGFDFYRCSPTDGVFNIATHKTIALSDI